MTILAANGEPGVTLAVPHATAVSRGQVVNFFGIYGVALMDRGEGVDVDSGDVVTFFPGVILVEDNISHSANATWAIGQKIYWESTAIDGSFLGPTTTGDFIGVLVEPLTVTARVAKAGKFLMWASKAN